LVCLEQQSFWYDEVVSAKIAQARLLDILSGRSGDLGNPPFYYFLLGVWQRAVGLGDGVLRSLSAVLSLACIPLVYALGKRLFDDKVGLVAAGLLSISPFHIYMAQEARTFALMSFLALASSLVLVDAFANPKHLWRWAMYALLVYLIPLSHYFGFFFLAGQFAFALWVGRGNKAALKGYFVAVGVGALLYCTWLPAFFRQLSAENNLARSADSWHLHVAASPMAFSVGTVLYWKSAAGLWRAAAAGVGTLALSSVVVAGLWRGRYQREALALPFACLASTVGIPLVLSVTLSPLYNVRYVFLAIPFWLLLAALGFTKLPRVAAVGGAAVYGVAAATALFVQYTSQLKDNWREAAQWLGTQAARNTRLAFYADIGETAFAWYAPDVTQTVRLLPPPNPNVKIWGTDRAGGVPDDVERQLVGEVCLVMTDEPDDYYRALFERHPITARVSQFVGIEITCANLGGEPAASR